MSQALTLDFLTGTTRSSRKAHDPLAFVENIRQGLRPSSLERIKKSLLLSDSDLAEIMGISSKSISRMRQKKSQRLSPIASDRLYRLAYIFTLTCESVGDQDLARDWLKTPQLALGNRRPLDLLQTEPGSREIEKLLGRIQYGVLS